MAMFSIRVELHNATSSDYVKLADMLRRVGIVDTVTSDQGQTYKLPPAEYSFVGNASLDQIHEATKIAAGNTGRAYEVVSNLVERRLWNGLPFA